VVTPCRFDSGSRHQDEFLQHAEKGCKPNEYAGFQPFLMPAENVKAEQKQAIYC
jgi:hypothetical protein